MTKQIIRTYKELIRIPSFEERFEYLKLNGVVGADTFGFDRYINQNFYSSAQWKKLRDEIIVRDNGCDLACSDRMIGGQITIHHMNPITMNDIVDLTEFALNPDYLICVSSQTHKAIHYGDVTKLAREPIVRSRNDTCPWKH